MKNILVAGMDVYMNSDTLKLINKLSFELQAEEYLSYLKYYAKNS